ncbi:MAG: hypothetical protein ACRD1H_07290 [Vicinamibacterales bacterium]
MSPPTIALLAPRLRVEERQLIAAFQERGHAATLLDAATLALPLDGAATSLPALALDREIATVELATLAALLATNGSVVVNRAATVRLLADRLALLRHLIVAKIPTPRTVVAFGEDVAVAALERIGYPALLQSLQVDPRMPDAYVPDRDAGEAAVEHRAMLGHERAVLVQQYILGPVSRVIVVGSEVAAVEAITDDGLAPYAGDVATLTELSERVIARLGSGIYAIEIVDSDEGPIVVGAGNLVDFRTLQESGVDVAGKIADYALSQLREVSDGG